MLFHNNFSSKRTITLFSSLLITQILYLAYNFYTLLVVNNNSYQYCVYQWHCLKIVTKKKEIIIRILLKYTFIKHITIFYIYISHPPKVDIRCRPLIHQLLFVTADVIRVIQFFIIEETLLKNDMSCHLPNKRRHVIPYKVQCCPMKNKRSFGIKMTCHQIYLIKNNMSSYLPEDDDIYVRQYHFTGT